MRRTDVVVPADRTAGLRIPPLAVTTGAPGPEWADVPMSVWRFRRRPALRLPLDPESARQARRYVRLAGWVPLTVVVPQLVWAAALFSDAARPAGPVALVVALVVLIGSQLVPTGRLPRQTPYRTRSGDLRIPGVPVEVAERWIEQNPGVTATDDPPPRRHSRRFYAAWSAGLLASAAGLAVVLVANGREDFILLWLLVPVLAIAAASMAFRMLPPGYIAFDQPPAS